MRPAGRNARRRWHQQAAYYRGMEAAAAPIDRRLTEVEGPVGVTAGQLSNCALDLWETARCLLPLASAVARIPTTLE
jgi:hypothetical protein